MTLYVSFAAIFCVLEFSHWTASFLIVTDPFMTRMVAFNGPRHDCAVSENRTAIMNSMLTSTTQHTVRAATDGEMIRLMDACQKHMARGKTMSGSGGAFVFPGTKWCGPGNIASNYNDLGEMTDEDRCCREHDHCPMSLAAGECKGNICNSSPYTRSECKCDVKFQNCLRRIHSSTADTIGTLFFNLVRVMCYNDPEECAKNPASCRYRYMPYYKSSEPRVLRNLLTQVFRGIVRLKQALKKSVPLRLH